MKIVLANLPWYKDGKWGVRAGSRWPHLKNPLTEGDYLPFPFFLAYSLSLLRRNGFEAIFIDALASKIKEEKFISDLNKIKPDLLVAEVSTPSLYNDLNILSRFDKDIKIAICGPEINIQSLEFLSRNKFIDFALIGEYEFTLLELVQKLDTDKDISSIPGIIYKNKDGLYKKTSKRALIEDLDSLPWPQREGLPIYRYIDAPGNIPLPNVQMLGSRGCPFKCRFCLWPQIMYNSSTYRARDPAKVVDEMEYVTKKHGFKSVYFDDDTFNIGKSRMIRFSRELKYRKLNIPWAIMARPDLMDEEILVEMKSAGLHSVKYGVESATQQLLNNIGKDMNLKKSIKMIQFSKEIGINTHLTFTFGLPGETKETIQKTIDLCLALNPTSAQFSITTPFPGTEYFKQLDRKGWILSKDFREYDGNYKCVIRTEYLMQHDLEEACQKAYFQWGKNKNKSESLFWRLRKRYKKLKIYILNFGIFLTMVKIIKYVIWKIRYQKKNYLNI